MPAPRPSIAPDDKPCEEEDCEDWFEFELSAPSVSATLVFAGKLCDAPKLGGSDCISLGVGVGVICAARSRSS
jgi:hypothetical protein